MVGMDLAESYIHLGAALASAEAMALPGKLLPSIAAVDPVCSEPKPTIHDQQGRAEGLIGNQPLCGGSQLDTNRESGANPAQT